MKVGKYLKNSAALAIATAMVVTALPAQAQERTWRGNRSEGSAEQRPSRGDRPAPQAAPQAQVRAPAPQAAPQAQVRAPARGPAPQVAQSSGNGGRGHSRGDGGQRGPGGQGSGQSGRQQDGWQRPQPQAQAPVRQQPQQQAQAQGQWRGGERNGTYTSSDRNRTYRSDDRRDGRAGRDGRDWRDGQRETYRDGNRDGYRSGDRDHRQWDRRWRDDRRYDWSGWRSHNRSSFNIGIYYSPYRNYSYRRLGIGYSLSSLFYSDRYWISDPWQYRLPEVYGPYRWVRYYDDVLLVDIYSGEVVDVIYDVFW